MPTYLYQCLNCEHSFEEILKIAERNEPTEKPCEKCGSKIEMQICSPPICDPVRIGVMKPKSDFKEVLQQIKRNNPGSTLDV